MSWEQYVKAATDLKFSKVCIIARANYQTLGSTNAQTDIATAWKDGDAQINENQELLDDWFDVKKKAFCFFGKKFNIILREKNESDADGLIACKAGKEGLVARQFKSIWFIAYCDDVSNGKEAKIKGLPNAVTKISNQIFDALVEAGV